ncbi:restriction endonuclease subunit S [Serratia sp. CY84636]|uniref:restriction endonuclease subunit S n=1 Tax=Serratia sp. CY84636 TaxID=3383695 RepID=UPI003F9FD628
MSGGKLPEGWVGPQLDEIATDINYGYTASSTSENIGPKMLRITDIQDNKVDWKSVPFCKIEDNQKDKYLLCNGDLVFARTGATVGKSFLINEDISNTVFASYLIRVRCNKKINSHYLSYFFLSPTYWNQITEFSAGIGQPNVNGSKLKKLNLPLASVCEQKIIAEKLDTLLAQVESTKARLEQIPQILKRFRQAVLAAAVSGKLTNASRNSHSLIDWYSTNLGALIVDSCNGLAKRQGLNGNEITILRLADFKDAQRIIGNERKIKLDTKEENKYSLADNDILVIRVNGSADLAGRFIEYKSTGDIEGFCDHFIRLRLDSNKIMSRFLTYIANEGEGRFYLRNSLSTSAGQNTINQTSIKGLSFLLPPLEEQHEIVRRVEQLFAYADTIEKQVNSALTRVNSLTQSILAKAFRGELTAQWRAENPDLISGENSAAALLEKIKAERAASGGKKTARKKA